MEKLKSYIPPLAEPITFTSLRFLCSWEDDPYSLRLTDEGSKEGVELPDDDFIGDGGIHLPDDPF